MKFGQMLAVRVDLFSDDFCTELGKLRSHAKPFAFEQVEKIIVEDLGRSIADAFLEFDVKPLAAASIAQVHAAKLPNGADVVVKVERPEVARSRSRCTADRGPRDANGTRDA